MKVAELKQVVDSNAMEMRENFAKIDERFERVDDNFADMRREMRTGFAVLERRIEESRKDMSHQIGVMMEKLMAGNPGRNRA